MEPLGKGWVSLAFQQPCHASMEKRAGRHLWLRNTGTRPSQYENPTLHIGVLLQVANYGKGSLAPSGLGREYYCALTSHCPSIEDKTLYIKNDLVNLKGNFWINNFFLNGISHLHCQQVLVFFRIYLA